MVYIKITSYRMPIILSNKEGPLQCFAGAQRTARFWSDDSVVPVIRLVGVVMYRHPEARGSDDPNPNVFACKD